LWRSRSGKSIRSILNDSVRKEAVTAREYNVSSQKRTGRSTGSEKK
jgi:hypothetical protein